MRDNNRVTIVAAAAAMLACFSASETAASDDLMEALQAGTLDENYFVGEWCLVGSTRSGDPPQPNLKYVFHEGGPLHYQRAATGDKLHYGSWKQIETMILISTPPTLMRTAGIDAISTDEFTVGDSIGYTFRRGSCE